MSVIRSVIVISVTRQKFKENGVHRGSLKEDLSDPDFEAIESKYDVTIKSFDEETGPYTGSYIFPSRYRCKNHISKEKSFSDKELTLRPEEVEALKLVQGLIFTEPFSIENVLVHMLVTLI